MIGAAVYQVDLRRRAEEERLKELREARYIRRSLLTSRKKARWGDCRARKWWTIWRRA